MCSCYAGFVCLWRLLFCFAYALFCFSFLKFYHVPCVKEVNKPINQQPALVFEPDHHSKKRRNVLTCGVDIGRRQDGGRVGGDDVSSATCEATSA